MGAGTRLVGKPSSHAQLNSQLTYPRDARQRVPRSAQALAHSHYYHHARLRAALRRFYAFTRRFSPYSALGKKRHAARRRYPRPASTHTPPEQPTGRAVETRRRETVLFINLQQHRTMLCVDFAARDPVKDCTAVATTVQFVAREA